MKKPKAKRVSKNRFIQLKADLAWDTIQAQLLVQIEKVLQPRNIRFEDYEILFTIPRHSTAPLPLAEEDHLKFLLDRALKSQDPVVNLMISPSVPDSDKVRLNLVFNARLMRAHNRRMTAIRVTRKARRRKGRKA